MEYGYSKVVDLSYEDAVRKVTEELKKEGFGVLTEIDVKATMKKKIDADMKPYIILGACNPQFAYKALQVEKQVGLLLPCNVIVYVDDDDRTVVAAMEVQPVMGIVENPELDEFAPVIREKIHTAIDAV
ncbi:DUF302 domain-containing protein [candidate division KSB1 bacterium]